MDEYISRHEAIRAVQLSYGNYEATRNALYEIPAADVAPVWHGWWADKQGGFGRQQLAVFAARNILPLESFRTTAPTAAHEWTVRNEQGAETCVL